MHIEKSRAYADALAAARSPMPSSTSHVEEVPDVITQANTKDKCPKQTMIMKVGLPLEPKGKGKAKETMPPIDVSDGDKQLDWGSDDENVERDIVEAAETPKPSWYEDTDQYDPNDSVAYDSIAPQVPFLSIGLIGSLIIESKQGQFCDGLTGRVDTPTCICNLEINTSLSAQKCSDCEKCKQSAMNKA